MSASAALALAALLAGSAAQGAPPAGLTALGAFDVDRAQGWPDKLALCDLTYFLNSRPDLEADYILAPDRDTRWVRRLRGPRFLPPNLFYDSEVRQAYERLRRAGLVTRAQASEARARHDRPFIERFRRWRGGAEDAFIQRQSEGCVAVLDQARLAR